MYKILAVGAVAIMCAIAAFFYFGEDKAQVPPAIMDSAANDRDPKELLQYEKARLAGPDGQIPSGIRSRELMFAKTLPTDALFKKAVAWTARGPYNVGGRTRGAGIDVANEQIIVAGGVSGGIWRSTDGGLSWTKRTEPGDLHNVTTLVQDVRPGKTATWYYGTGEGSGNSASGGGAFFYGDGLFKSTDNGLTWNQLSSTASVSNTTFEKPWQVVYRLATDASNMTEDEVYAATYGNIYRSTDGGQSWQVVLGNNMNSYFTDVVVTSPGVVYATLSSESAQRGIWRSPDGITWTNLTPPGFAVEYNRLVPAVNPMNEDQVYILGVTPGSGMDFTNYRGDTEWVSLWQYTYLDGDGADTNGHWVDLSQNLPNKAPRSFDNFNAQGSYNLMIKVKPDDSNVVFIGGTNLYRSTDAFKTPGNTTQIGGYEIGTRLPDFQMYEDHHPDQHDLLFYPSNPDKVLNLNDGGLFKTDNSLAGIVRWQPLNRGYNTTQVYTVTINEEKVTNTLFGGFQDNGNQVIMTNDPEGDWVNPYNGDGSFAAIPADEDVYYLSKHLGRIVKMKLNSDGSRGDFTRIDPIGARDYQFINPFVIDPSDEKIMYLPAGRSLWRNNNLDAIPLTNTFDSISTNWFRFSDTLSVSTLEITAIGVSKASPSHRVYYGTNRRKVYRVDNANTGDPAHQDITFVQFPPSGYVNCIAVDPDNGDHVVVVFSNYGVYSIFTSWDAGATWEKCAGNLEQNDLGLGSGPSVRWLAVMKVDGRNAYFAGTSAGLFATDTLLGLSTMWRNIGATTIGNVVVEMVKTRQADNLVAVGTHGNGIYTGHVNTLIDITGVEEVTWADKIGLKTYPNPASTIMTIEFNTQGKVQLSLFDEAGRTLETRTVAKGQDQKLNWDFSKYPAGIYYFNVISKEGEATKSLVIQR
ncbi:MAG: T9SS type A sorting domain-containing protein [Bacteroidia bacterium]